MLSRWRLWLAAAFLLLLFAIAAVGYRNATSAPLVRRMNLTVPGLPPGQRPIRVLLFSDVHVHGPDMPPQRVAAIVKQINALRPDLVIAAGDYVGANWFGRAYSVDDAVAPLAGLKAPLGVYAVLGNHDDKAGEPEVAQALRRANIRVLVNQTVSAGPLAIAGIDGRLLPGRRLWQARREKVLATLQRTPGAKLVVAHRPDEFHWMPSWVSLVMAGHTHCGQIVLPVIGALLSGSDFGERYRCGLIQEHGNLMVVTAGLGTSKFPLRIGAPADIWVIELRGSSKRM